MLSSSPQVNYFPSFQTLSAIRHADSSVKFIMHLTSHHKAQSHELGNKVKKLSVYYNIQNSISLIHNLKNIIHKNTKLCSFNIKIKYTTISVTGVKNIMKEILDDNHTPENKKHE
jgi:hypothetical protein